MQRRYRSEGRPSDPYYFSRLVRTLHGAPAPLAYRRGGVHFQARLDAVLARFVPAD